MTVGSTSVLMNLDVKLDCHSTMKKLTSPVWYAQLIFNLSTDTTKTLVCALIVLSLFDYCRLSSVSLGSKLRNNGYSPCPTVPQTD